jgi:superoxide oxidase
MISFADKAIQGPLIFIHKSMGVFFLGLLIFRFIWRQMNTIPTVPETSFSILSKLSVPVLYLSMLSMPLSGILMSQAAGYPVSFFGLFTLPTLLSKSPELGKTLQEVHEYSAFILIALIIIHTMASFYHHYILKDSTFLRMLKNIEPKKED